MPRYLVALVAVVLGFALLPATANAAHNPNNTDPCAGAPTADEYVDRNDARDVHEQSIDCVIYRSIAVGSTNDAGQQVYNPRQNVTRGQMASFIAQTLVAGGYDDELPAGEGADEFDDISGNTHRLNINRLAKANIVRGTGNGNNYAPNAHVLRQQMASFIVQAAEFAVGDDHPVERDATDRFVDVSPTNVHKNNIEAGADANPVLFRGFSATQFNPGETVERDQMASFLVNLLRYIFAPGQAPATVNVTDSSVRPGEPVTGAITGDVASARVAGCGITDQAVSDTDANTQGIQFSITIPQGQQPGSCQLTFTITDSSGNSRTRSISVTVEGQAATTGATERPDLTEVTNGDYRTETTRENVPGRRQGANFRFVFDEAVTCASGNTNLFRVYSYDGASYQSTTCEQDPNSTRAVFVSFLGVNTQGRFDDLTTAGNLFGAVVGSTPNQVITDEATEGDVALFAGSRPRTTQFAPGVTQAPDLSSVTVTTRNAGTATAPSRTAVDFTFDEEAWTVNPNGFQLVLTDGTTVPCQGPAANDTTTAGGGNVPGGNGTRTITVTCDRAAGTTISRIESSEVARGVVQEGTVRDNTQPTAYTNPLQTANVSGDGNVTDEPNLTQVRFRNANDTDLVQFVFDKAVQNFGNPNRVTGAAAQRFKVYVDSSEEYLGTEANRSTQPGESNVVFVRFDRNVSAMVGGSVEEAAVVGQDAPAAGEPNSPDEESVQAVRQTENTLVGGRTNGPDLNAVRIYEDRNAQGTLQGLRVIYEFDENIDNALLNDNGFHIYTDNGRRFNCTDARIGDPDRTVTPAETRAQVVCTQYTTPGSFTAAQIRDAILNDGERGTVEESVVEERSAGNGRDNPVGAEGVSQVR